MAKMPPNEKGMVHKMSDKAQTTVLKFLHFGDIHLDTPFAGLSPEKSDERRRGLRENFIKMMEYVRGAGIDYVLCSRTTEGVEITGNLVLCTVENEKVIAAYGTWCFFTPGTSYSAQLTDVLNILFNVKKDLGTSPLSASSASGDEPERNPVTIEAIKSCYSLYFFGEERNFCLIPCWQITTDTRGDLIYNAINGTLYTKIME